MTSTHGPFPSFFLIVLIAFFFFFVSSSSSVPLPPRQNEIQAGVWERANGMAVPASQNIIPSLLSFFDSSEFRATIADIPQLNGTNASDILQVLQNIIYSSNQNHNFAPSNAFALEQGLPLLDTDLSGMIGTGFIPNFYTAGYLDLIPYVPFLAVVENYAEVTLFDYPPFANFSSPTFAEALTRPQYTCVNFFRNAGGCVPFGAISFSISRGWSNNMTVLSPVDSGYYTGCCLLPNSTTNSSSFASASERQQLKELMALREQVLAPFVEKHKNNPVIQKLFEQNSNNTNATHGIVCELPINCSAWDGTLGTLQNFNHLLLANAGFWMTNISDVFRQYYQPTSAPTTMADFIHITIGYLEGTIAGSVPFPQGVSHLEVGTAQLLGTNRTDILRNWAVNNSWPLIWVQGMSLPKNESDITPYLYLDLIDLFLDPFLLDLTNVTNISPENVTLSQDEFNTVSDIAQFYLQENPDAVYDGIFWVKVYSLLKSSVDPGLWVRYPRIDECLGDIDNCFAVQITTGACVCKVN